MCLCIVVCLSLSLRLCLSVCVSVYLSVCLLVCMWVSISVSLHLFACLSLRLVPPTVDHNVVETRLGGAVGIGCCPHDACLADGECVVLVQVAGRDGEVLHVGAGELPLVTQNCGRCITCEVDDCVNRTHNPGFFVH